MRSAGNAAQRVVQQLDAGGRPFAAMREVDLRVHRPMARQMRVVDLQDQAGVDDRLVFLVQRVGERDPEFLVGLVMLVGVPIGEVGRRHRRHKGFLVRDPGEGGFEIVDVALQCVMPAIGDRAGADPLGRRRPPGGARHLRRPVRNIRERPGIRATGPVLRRGALGARLDPGEALVDIGDEPEPPHLAIGDDVDAALGSAF